MPNDKVDQKEAAEAKKVKEDDNILPATPKKENDHLDRRIDDVETRLLADQLPVPPKGTPRRSKKQKDPTGFTPRRSERLATPGKMPDPWR